MRYPILIIGFLVAAALLGFGLVQGARAPMAQMPDHTQSPALIAQVQDVAQVDTTTPAQTQPQTVTPGTSVQTVTTATPTSKPVDETALRYFARQGDTRRVDAEMARLRALYPDWEPPKNLLTNDYTPDASIEAIWTLYGNGDYAGARAAIAAKQQADPSYQPSADLLASLDLGEATVRLRNASDIAEYATVISIAANHPTLLTCESIDNLWRLAEAFIKTGVKQRGIDAYDYILTNCTVAADRFATMQKAMALLDFADVTPLLAMEKKDANGIGEFAPLRLDVIRQAIASALDAKTTNVPKADVDQLATSTRATKAPDDLRLLGWYALERNLPAEGRDWFDMAMTADKSLESAHGMAVALLDLRRYADAEAVLADYRDENADVSTLYLTIAASLLSQDPRVTVDALVLERIVAQTVADRSAATAQELGWYAYAFQQPTTAIEWFRLALSWDASNEPAAYGLLVASDAMKDAATVKAIKEQWGARSPRIASFGTAAAATTAPAPASRSAATTSATPVRQVAARSSPQPSSGGGGSGRSASCAGFVPPESLSPAGALQRAWCLMDLNRPTDAAANFARALQSSTESVRSDAAYGQSLAYIRLGLPRDAMVAASSAPQTRQRAVQLQGDINTQAAIRAYEIGDYRATLIALDERARFAPEQNDLLTMRAWSYFHLKRYRESEQIFAAVVATGYGPAVGGLNTVQALLAGQANN